MGRATRTSRQAVALRGQLERRTALHTPVGEQLLEPIDPTMHHALGGQHGACDMFRADESGEQAIQDHAYFLWEIEGRPEGRALDHWLRAADHPIGDEEKIMAGRADANLPALLTKDVPGG